MSADSFDRRLTPARADLAAAHLCGLVDAPRYAEGRAMRIIAASAPLRRSPAAHAPLEAASQPTHRVPALRTHPYPVSAIKLPPLMALSLGAQLTIVGREGDFA